LDTLRTLLLGSVDKAPDRHKEKHTLVRCKSCNQLSKDK